MLLSFLYPIKCFTKAWTCGQETVFYFMFSFFLVLYKMFYRSVDLWTRSCFLSLLYPLYFGRKCGQVDKLWTFWKKNQPHLCFIQKCGLADKKLSFNFLFLSCLAPFKIMSKSMNTSKGPFLYYVRVFWGFFELPTHLRKDIFTS